MSLLDNSLWAVLRSSVSAEIWSKLWPSIFDTLYMTALASLIVLVFGLTLGVLLTVTSPDGLFPLPAVYKVWGWLINTLRSLPQMVMIIMLIPLARFLFGKSYGANPCIVAIAASCIPMYARVVESSLLEINKGKIEAAKSIGSSNLQIIFHALLPETLPSLIRGFTITVIAVLSMTALAGMFGAGGIGDVAVRYGYQRFQHDKLLACIYVLVVLVQIVQSAGNFVSNRILKTRALI